MKSYRSIQRGFTLVEILIVVIILGILAAIVIPQFSNASSDARESSTRSQLHTFRAQIELYKMQHNDTWPTSNGTISGTWDWAKLTGKTAQDGTKGDTEKFGPYVQSELKNPLNNSSTVASEAATGVGWVLDSNGKLSAANAKGDGLFAE